MYAYCEAPSKKIHVEFGEVHTGAVAVKWIEIVNENCIEQIYEARRDAITNPLDHVFELSSYSWTLSPGKVYKCKICYRPFVPFSVNTDYFMIVDSSHNQMEIKVCGTCIGPVMSVSTTRLVMMCTNGNTEAKKRIRLVNNSEVITAFMFDIDQVQRSFTVDMTHGYVGSRSRTYVTITFAPRQIGIYTCRLPCLILHHKPIIVELYGYCGAVLRKANVQEHFNYPARSKNGFEGYMNDIVVAAQDQPAVSLSKNYIDFGQAGTRVKNDALRIPETFCLTNHSRSDVLIKWDRDVENTFHITPETVGVPASQTVLFEVVFDPNGRSSNLFTSELVGYVQPMQREGNCHKETLTFPAMTSIRLIGHSFPVCSDGWIPQYEIPHIIKMPPCVPSFPVYTTFAIKRFGHLPLMYRFVPPESSRFVVKPMMGIIYQDYQVVVVGMLPESDNRRVYVERWAIRFNGNAKSECFIDFRGLAEHAEVTLGDQNVLRLTPCFLGCRLPQQFLMRNITLFVILCLRYDNTKVYSDIQCQYFKSIYRKRDTNCIFVILAVNIGTYFSVTVSGRRYEFVNTKTELQIPNASGEIRSNDTLTHEWEFCPTITGDYDFDVNCILTVLKDEIPVGASVSVALRVIGRCEVGFLESVPKELNFGILAYKATKKLSFLVFNSSPVIIFYKMTCNHCNWPIGNVEQDVKIHPSAGAVLAGQSETITASITPTTPGYYELFVQYFVRINLRTNTLIPNQTPRNICKLRCLCVLPTLKVKDLQCYGVCPVTSKVFLWKLMKINLFNKLLEHLQPGTSETLHMNFPAMIFQESPVTVKLLLTNANAVTASWSLKRVQLCSCRPVVKAQALSIQRAQYDCWHRKVCSMQPKMGNFQPGDDAWISLELRYVLLGKTEAKWDMDLGNDRHIFLIMAIKGLSGTANTLHILNGTRFKFQHVYFGDKDPIYQVCWLYNGTNRNVPFSVDRNTTREINRRYCHELFFCATPHGIASPQSAVPILLKFQPRRFGVFEGKLSLILGDEKEELTLEGESFLPHKSATVGEYVPPYVSYSSSNYSSGISDIPIYFSTYCIDISYIATHSHVVKMVMLHSNLDHDVLAYEWKRYEIPEIICVEVCPRRGLIQPMATQTFYATICTGGYPCIIDVNVLCEFVNTSQRRDYQRSIYKHADLSQELEGQFTLTEKGISVPKSTIGILEKPQSFYKAMTVRCSIHSLEDKFLKVDLIEELKSAPPYTIYIEENQKQETTFREGDISRASFILEGLLWEIVNSKLFKSLIKDVLQNQPNLFYSQFTMNLHERKSLIRRSYISPPRALINRLLEEMLFVIVHEEFALETTHLIQHMDIRHTSYLSIVSGMNRKKAIHRETRLLHHDREYSVAIPKSSVARISFYDKSIVY
ncbi:cilia- and flagella-associated protein 65-like [Odontomachus brunneus]|uniref:cilia- and flagella-associated protein 65-like n=1 Tax=Odontomachus brunneus TaxID=486640 RepID=UPI0013F28A71|nr:cilia- and flagella-associated protein 65-like [Odontomachus brunneus]